MPTQVFLLQLCVELQLQFLNWELWKFYAKISIARYFMIAPLFKNCAWLQQFYISIESLRWNMFNRKFCEKTNMLIGLQTAITFAKLIILLIQIHGYELEMITQNPCLERIWWKLFTYKANIYLFAYKKSEFKTMCFFMYVTCSSNLHHLPNYTFFS